jgi:hypothetical protein
MSLAPRHKPWLRLCTCYGLIENNIIKKLNKDEDNGLIVTSLKCIMILFIFFSLEENAYVHVLVKTRKFHDTIIQHKVI